MQARYRSDIDIKQSTRTTALGTELTARAKTISVFAAGHRCFYFFDNTGHRCWATVTCKIREQATGLAGKHVLTCGCRLLLLEMHGWTSRHGGRNMHVTAG
jgi:hypothetical protein